LAGVFQVPREKKNFSLDSRHAMKKTPSPVILSAAKDLTLVMASLWKPEILRCAQDDIWKQVWNGLPMKRIYFPKIRSKNA
jgi:hypothetical protein